VTAVEVGWDQSVVAWRVVGYQAARTALADPHLDVVAEAAAPASGVPTPAEWLASWFSRSPRDQHLAAKRHLLRAYTRPALADLGPTLARRASALASHLPDRCDLAGDYLRPFILLGVADMLGLPEGEQARFTKAVTVLSAVLGRPALDEDALRAVGACMQYLEALVQRMLVLDEAPPLVLALCSLVEGEVWPAVSALAQVLTAGFHPTVTGAAQAWRALHEGGSLRAARAAELGALVEEVLRLHPPFPFLHRWTREPCSCLGVALPAGAHIVVDVRAANRDPVLFPDPDQVRPGRPASLSFGHGSHRCLGAHLARLQMTVALQTLLALDRPPVPLPATEAPPQGHLLITATLPCRREAVALPGQP
jgi:cytochrome P450